MYYVDKKSHKHQRMRHRLVWIVIILVIAVVIFIISNLRLAPKQELHSSPSLSRKSNIAIQKRITITKPELTTTLAPTWKETSVVQTSTAPRYTFTDTANSRVIEFYIDNPPVHLGINQAIVVSGIGEKLAYESVSGNCVTFTDVSKADPQNGLARAKWQEVEFLCDVANRLRAVVGTISKDGTNQFHVQTPTGLSRKVFISYSDNNINPDYNEFYEILRSTRFL
jgi:hypothetical protein